MSAFTRICTSTPPFETAAVRTTGNPARYAGLYGLSCVENQILALLREAGTDVTPLYYDSAVPLSELATDLLLRGVAAERYRGVTRVQDDLRTRGILRIRRVWAGAGTLPEALRQGAHLLIRVDPGFTTRRLHARGLRDDHFALLRRADDEELPFLLYNDIPAVTAALSAEELAEAYAGEYLAVSPLRSLDASDWDWFDRRRRFRPEDHVPYEPPAGLLDTIPDAGPRLGRLLVVYKLLRGRMGAYYARRAAGRLPLEQLDRLHTLTEYRNLKDGADFTARTGLLRRLCELDNAIMEQCRR